MLVRVILAFALALSVSIVLHLLFIQRIESFTIKIRGIDPETAAQCKIYGFRHTQEKEILAHNDSIPGTWPDVKNEYSLLEILIPRSDDPLVYSALDIILETHGNKYPLLTNKQMPQFSGEEPSSGYYKLNCKLPSFIDSGGFSGKGINSVYNFFVSLSLVFFLILLSVLIGNFNNRKTTDGGSTDT
jgi:hypothetical protein